MQKMQKDTKKMQKRCKKMKKDKNDAKMMQKRWLNQRNFEGINNFYLYRSIFNCVYFR